mgnify:CR=1 FL=1|jgi:hypothetical protein
MPDKINSHNTPDIPSISSLHKEKNVKESSKNDIFNIVLNKIVQKITYTNRHTNQTYIIFEIPQILIGYPQYDMKSCILFVINRLSENGYMVDFLEPFYLYIDWGSNNTYKEYNIKSRISQKHKDKLQNHTKELLTKFPEIEFIYEDDVKKKQHKKNIKKNKK